MDVRGVLFDFGNTLFAHDPLPVTIAACALRLGVPIGDDLAVDLARRIDAAATTPDELAHRRDLDAAVWSRRWRILYGFADEFVEGLGDAVYASMHDPSAWVPYQSSGATLRRLHERGIAIGIVSNTGWDVRAVFSHHSLANLVTSFTLSYEVGLVKPDRRIFAAACYALEIVTGDVVMVGDDPRADGGAVMAGIRTLLLPAVPPHADNGLGAVIALVGIGD